ncbi:hypothetical protein Sta7437_0555 [Stanieria cyanosphaera PCC 7437]|uniref:Uncharacterized protein n=1 Tax=Stanieria cyanosphaera (strain ATCC 29371 / PCC 7437) TaxID=111780 RepID=K9XQ37_STAC7|nr:hypothetical protein [Stanieria cyanosphaera]AFZ34156.1 hypothetical protein Sta7437_0555 [Stanieria cyanosphaera PCC 7437]
MADILILLLEWFFRIFGIFWIVGGLIAFKMAQEANFIDSAIESLTQEKEDKLVSQFLLISSLLTLLSGIGLAIASRLVIFPLSLLVAVQVFYFTIQRQRFISANTEELREQAQISPKTKNAFIVSLIVTAIAFVGIWLSVLQ